MGSTKLTGRVIFKGNPGYNSAIKNWNPIHIRYTLVFFEEQFVVLDGCSSF